MIYTERVFFGLHLEFCHRMDDYVIIVEGHMNLENGFYLRRSIYDDEESFGYSMERSSKGSVTGERSKAI